MVKEAEFIERLSSQLDLDRHFRIEISIPMRKIKGHFSRAPGIVLNILKHFNGGTFFEGQGYWKGIQEPVIYIIIAAEGVENKIFSELFDLMSDAQRKLKQQEVFVQIDGRVFIGSLNEEAKVENYPDQWVFDDDMGKIVSNKTSKYEIPELIFARAKHHERDYRGAAQLYEEALTSLEKREPHLISLGLNQNEAKTSVIRDSILVTCNLLGIYSRTEFKDEIKCSELIQILNIALPYGSPKDGGLDPDIFPPHAEARMRGNRLKLLEDEEIKFTDGIYALKLIADFLESGNNPHLEQDPIEDMKTIRKHLKILNTTNQSIINDLKNELKGKFPHFSDEFEDALGLK